MNDPLQGSMIAIHGPPKIGKTQVASHFPGPVQFLATEFGHKFLPDDQKEHLIQLPPDTGWDVFRAVVKKEKKFGWKPKTIVIDTISGLYQLCFDWICRENRWSHPSDDGHGKGWAAIRREFADALNRLAHLAAGYGSTLVVLDHTKEELIETTTANIKKLTFGMSGQARDIVLRIPDYMWFIGYAEEDPSDAKKVYSDKRALFIRGNSNVEAGTRNKQVKVRVIMPLSEKDPYKQILRKLNGETKENE